MERIMNNILLAPSETISLDQGVHRYSCAGQSGRHDRRLEPRVAPNAPVDPIGGTVSVVAGTEFDWLIAPEMGSFGYLTIDATEDLETFDPCLRLLEGMADPTQRHMPIFGWPANFAPIPAIQTLADRSRAALGGLTKLDPGWDGYNGSPVLPRVADHALRLLEVIGAHTQIVPDVVPLSNGGVQLEWYVGVHEIEVEIGPDCATRLHRECTGDGDPTEVPIRDLHVTSEVAAFFRVLRR